MATRREVLAAGLGIATLSACGVGPSDTGLLGDTSGTCGSTLSGSTLELCFADYPQLDSVDGTAIITTSRGRLIVVRTGQDSAITTSDVCTHAGCALTWRSSQGVLFCPCHAAAFSTSGAVLQGPAHSALATYRTTVHPDGITVEL